MIGMHDRKRVSTIARNLGYPLADVMRLLGVSSPNALVNGRAAVRTLSEAHHAGQITRDGV
jgi:hypothetical protein